MAAREEPGHGRRQPCRQDGAACRRQAERRDRALRWLPCLRKICAHNAISFDDTRERELASGATRTVHVAAIDHDRCVGCGRCIAACNQDCIKPGYDAAADVLNCKIAGVPRPLSTAARASISRLPWISAPTAIAIPKRHAHRQRYRHVRELRPGRHRPGLRRRRHGIRAAAQHRAHR
ncbi:MAG: DUF362 domain-containing protein [Collinsella sp.]